MRYHLTTALAASLLLFGCETESTSPGPKDETKPGTNTTSKPAEKKPETKGVAMPDKTPAVFRVKFEMTCGDCVVECHRDWAPIGADRFFELVKKGFYKDIAFFRVLDDFMAQFGISGDPDLADEWSGSMLQDDPVKQSNTRGMMTYAKTNSPHSRTTQMFINFRDNRNLDRQGFAPFAKVVEGMANIDKIYIGPVASQSQLQAQGNAYLKTNFPQMDYIKRAVYLGEPGK